MGGFANITLKNEKKTIAYDICPANLILNSLANKLNKPYDKDGEMASKGKLIPELERKLNKLNFFKLKPPKSLGIEWVKENILPIFEIYQKCSINDILHTYTIFIAKKISYELSGRKEALVTGGGAFNSFLIEQIKNRTSCLIRIPEKKVINFNQYENCTTKSLLLRCSFLSPPLLLSYLLLLLLLISSLLKVICQIPQDAHWSSPMEHIIDAMPPFHSKAARIAFFSRRRNQSFKIQKTLMTQSIHLYEFRSKAQPTKDYCHRH